MLTDSAAFRSDQYHQASDTPDRIDYAPTARAIDGLEKSIEALAGPSSATKPGAPWGWLVREPLMTGKDPTSSTFRSDLMTWGIIALIAFVAAVHSFSATRSKSPTFDEPVHVLSSWLIARLGDFRVNPEHPPLWKLVAGLPIASTPLVVDLDRPIARDVLRQTEMQGPFANEVLFRSGSDGVTLIATARAAMSLFLVLTVLVTARWAWQAGGSAAAVIAALLVAFDPNFLAHGTLVTNDVAASFIFILAGYLTWQLGRRFNWTTATLLMLTCAAGAGIKFTCVMLVPIVGLPLVVRALQRGPWVIWEKTVFGRASRLAAVMGLALATGVVTWAAIWLFYFARPAPVPDGSLFDASYPRHYLAYNAVAKALAERGTPVTREEIDERVPTYTPSISMRTVYWLQDHRFIPQALGHGLTYAAGRGILRPSFLLGDYSDTGFWLYFPVAIVTKTPLVTLALLLTTAILGLLHRNRWLADLESRWLVLCLLSCPAIYLTFAVLSNLNLGLRHILPIYPMMYVAAGIALAGLIRTARPARFLVPAALVLLAVETVSAFPNYIAFFNRAVGGERGGLAILGDSNLDWGQDLPALSDWFARWRAGNPGDAFYLAYFGSVDPTVYGIEYINMSPGYPYDTRPPTLDLQRDGVVAISASFLQGTYPEDLRPVMANLRSRRPIDILNGSLYLYEYKKPASGK